MTMQSIHQVLSGGGGGREGERRKGGREEGGWEGREEAIILTPHGPFDQKY